MSRERHCRGSKYESGNQRTAHGIVSFFTDFLRRAMIESLAPNCDNAAATVADRHQ
jgi:hypothetical protein